MSVDRTSRPAQPPHMVIVGGGFGGLNAARAAARYPLRITVVDGENHHLFQPLLYQVATAALPPGDIAEPIRSILRKCGNVRVRMGEATAVDLDQHQVHLADGSQLPYDYLILATGARHAYFGHPDWEPLAPSLKSVADALEIRWRIFRAFEAAGWEPDPAVRRAWLTFVIVGGGPTGASSATPSRPRSKSGLVWNSQPGHSSTRRPVVSAHGTEPLVPACLPAGHRHTAGASSGSHRQARAGLLNPAERAAWLAWAALTISCETLMESRNAPLAACIVELSPEPKPPVSELAEPILE